MRITLNATNAGAGAEVTESPNDNGWGINLHARVDDDMPVKLATGRSLADVNCRVSIQSLSASRMKGTWVGVMDYHEGVEAYAEMPGFPDTVWISLYVSEKVLAETLKLCAMGHLPNVTVHFPDDDTGPNLETVPKKPNGLSYEGTYFWDSINWDNKNFRKVGVKAADIGFRLTPEPGPKLDAGEAPHDSEVKAAAEARLPATRAQIALLTSTVRNVGIGLGILLIVLHYIR